MSDSGLELIRDGATAARLTLAEERDLVLGRAGDADLRVADEPFLGKRHLRLRLSGARLSVERLPQTTNPVYCGGEAKDAFTLASGESFVVGGTRFRFFLGSAASRVEERPDAPHAEGTVARDDLYAFGAASARLRLLDLLELPEALRGAPDEASRCLRAACLVRLATGARWACVLDADGRVLAKDGADDVSTPRVSRRLVAKASAEAPLPTYYRWSGAADAGATAMDGVSWAVCAAAPLPDGRRLSFYAAGDGAASGLGDDELRQRARFTGLVADMVGRALATETLSGWQKRLERFFSPPVAAKILKSGSTADLEPRLAEATVLFFDLRGFSRRTEESNELVLQYMGELRRVMTEMTRLVLAADGAVLGYIGDAILACWNLPFPDPRHADKACAAALAMSAALARMEGGWRCGIGLDSGEVVAGAVGSDQMFSYSVMGAVVNTASRVEGLTKQIEAPILITSAVAARLSTAAAAPRRLGRFQPAGMSRAVELFELREAAAAGPDDARFAEGAVALERGDWAKAYDALDGLPTSDLPARYLKSLAEQCRRKPPKSWAGVIELDAK